LSEFTPIASLVGGVIIGLASLTLLLSSGRIAGVSGIFGGFLHFTKTDTLWRFMFLLGLLSGGLVLGEFLPQSLDIQLNYSAAAVMLAGLLVGIGSRMGNGCTSGHGVCGVGRLSPRSLVAAVTFLVTGAIAAVLVARFFGGVI
jgi:uncharacterized protein